MREPDGMPRRRMRRGRSHALWAMALAALVLRTTPGVTQTAPFPNRPLTFISPYALSANATIRVIAEAMGRELGQLAIVVPRDGGSGIVGLRALAGAPPDGYTLAYTPVTGIVVQPHLVRNIGIGPDSVASVCGAAENILGVVARADAPFRDARDLVAEAKRRPVTYGSAGPNSIPAIGVHRMQVAAGGEYIHAPFRGDQQPITEVLAGRLDFAAIVVSSGTEMIRAGALRLLGVFADRRHPDLPEGPTMAELGIDAVQRSYVPVLAPRGTPGPILDRLEAACRAALDDPAVRRFATTAGVVIGFTPRAEMDRVIRREYEAFGTALHALGVQPE